MTNPIPFGFRADALRVCHGLTSRTPGWFATFSTSRVTLNSSAFPSPSKSAAHAVIVPSRQIAPTMAVLPLKMLAKKIGRVMIVSSTQNHRPEQDETDHQHEIEKSDQDQRTVPGRTAPGCGNGELAGAAFRRWNCLRPERRLQYQRAQGVEA